MSRKRLIWLASVLLGAGAYWGATRIGYAIAFVHGSVSAVWPPTGVALALVWLGGPRMLPAVFLGELTGDLSNGSPLIVSVAFACGSCAEALAGWALLCRARFRTSLDRVRDVFALLALTALVSTMASATIGTLTLLAHRDISMAGVWSTWHVWWLGDVTGDIVVAPALLVLASGRPRAPRGWRAAETAAFAATLAALGLVAHQLTLGIAYLVLPVLIWASLRFRQTGAVVANAVLAATGVIGAAGATSDLARVSVLDRILFTQNFVAVGAVTTLVLAALISERDRTAAALKRARAHADDLVAERSAVAEIAFAVARRAPLHQILTQITEQAARLLKAGGARIVHSAAQAGGPAAIAAQTGALSEPALVAAIVPAGNDWGRLEVHAPDPRAAGGDGGASLLVRLSGLAEQALVNDLAQRTLVFEATTDALTGLRNQRAFQRGIRDEVERALRYRRPLALVLIDIDNFKQVNDRAGHQTGDAVLAEVAQRMLAALRMEALVARLGGDELAIVLPECDGDAAYLVAERVREAVAAAPASAGNRVTISVGIAQLADVDSEHALIGAADAALYAAKRMGGDMCVRHTAGMPATGARPR